MGTTNVLRDWWGVRLLVAGAAFGLMPCLAAGNREAEPQQLGQVLAELHVVEGKIRSSERSAFYSNADGTIYEVELEVWRVYCGEGVAGDARFKALMGEGQWYARAPGSLEIAMLDRKSGDHRIWLIGWDPRENGYTGKSRPDSVLEIPSNQIFLTDWHYFLPFLGNELGDEPEKLEAAPKVAAALYALSKAKDEAERVRLLQGQIRGGDPYVAVTDAWLLFKAEAVPDRARVAMELFLDPKVPLVARTCLAALVRGPKWPDPKLAPRRVTAYVEMAGAAGTRRDFHALADALRRAARADLTIPECLEVTRAALGNRRFLETCEGGSEQELVRFAESVRTDQDLEKVLEFFAPLIGAGADGRFEYGAASAIAYATAEHDLSPGQAERVSKLRAACRSERAAYYLDLAMRPRAK